MTKILFVEDDPMISDIYNKKFESAGFDVISARTGGEVLAHLKKQKFDLVLLDLVLPEMTGMDVLRKIRADHNIADTNVAIFSNLGEEEHFDEASKLGAIAYITKSAYTPSEAVEEIKKLIGILESEK
ncbi:MAG: response regulator [Candidatus Moranbacteria bacterium]|nr:response regulator [Candidatus Moranbacteria bacterium]